MSSIFLIITALLPLLTSTLQQFKVISPGIAGLITGIEGAGAAVVTELTNNTTGKLSITASSLLGAMMAATSVLKTETSINPVALIIITAFESAAAAGLAASNISSVDPSKLHPIEGV